MEDCGGRGTTQHLPPSSSPCPLQHPHPSLTCRPPVISTPQSDWSLLLPDTRYFIQGGWGPSLGALSLPYTLGGNSDFPDWEKGSEHTSSFRPLTWVGSGYLFSVTQRCQSCLGWGRWVCLVLSLALATCRADRKRHTP